MDAKTRDEVRGKAAVVKKTSAVAAVITATVFVALYQILPELDGMEAPVDRLIFTLRCNVFAALMVFAGIEAVAIMRGGSEAIDPLAGKESRAIRISGNYTENTLQQFVLFFVATMALSTFLDDGASMRVVPILTIIFVLARIVFWVGYLRDPILRSPGMAATGAPIIVTLAYVVYRIVREIAAGG